MIRLFTFVMLSTLIVHGCGSDDGPALGASHVRVFAPLPGRAATVAYLEIKNFSARPITLNSVSSPAFARSELHETSIVDGVASMRPLASVVIEPRSQVKFAPGGKHIMLIDPVKGLVPGASIPLELHYDHAGLLLVEAEVQTRLDDNDN